MRKRHHKGKIYENLTPHHLVAHSFQEVSHWKVSGAEEPAGFSGSPSFFASFGFSDVPESSDDTLIELLIVTETEEEILEFVFFILSMNLKCVLQSISLHIRKRMITKKKERRLSTSRPRTPLLSLFKYLL